MPARPLLQALVLADYVYVDQRTGKKVIAGTFNRIGAQDLPTQFGRPTYAFVSLTEVFGRVPLELRYVDLSNQEILMETTLELTSDDPLQTHEIVHEIPPFPMPHPGVYSFEVLCAGEPLGSVRVHVEQIPQEPPAGNGPSP